MERHDYSKLVKRLGTYYEKPEMFKNPERNNEYYSKIQHIPGGEVIDQIFSTITDEYDYIPRNLPKAIKGAWEKFRAGNPDKFISANGSPDGCQYCVNGWITFRVNSYEYTGTCGHCNSILPNENIPVVTMDQLESVGGDVIG